MECLALGFRHLSAHADAALCPLVHVVGCGVARQVGHVIFAVFMGDERLEASLHELVETFGQRQRECILDRQILVLVVDGVAAVSVLVVQIVVGVGIVF